LTQWHRLYSYRHDGANFETLESCLLGYAGPSLVVIRTKAEGSVLGAMCHSTWKDRRHYYGSPEAFLFQLAPEVHVHPATGAESNFMYLHRTPPMIDDLTPIEAQPHGLGLGGCMQKPRLFIPESMTRCSADFVDRTFASGSLLPNEAMERFEIDELEVWGVGGAAVIEQALAKRDEFRQLQHAAQVDAGSVRDKSFVVEDFTSGLMDNKLFEHQQTVRGRHEFQVDDLHGGYKLQC
jgi:TLD